MQSQHKVNTNKELQLSDQKIETNLNNICWCPWSKNTNTDMPPPLCV